eukprot:2349641-Pleurochrysis_carterae.AAC.1
MELGSNESRRFTHAQHAWINPLAPDTRLGPLGWSSMLHCYVAGVARLAVRLPVLGRLALEQHHLRGDALRDGRLGRRWRRCRAQSWDGADAVGDGGGRAALCRAPVWRIRGCVERAHLLPLPYRRGRWRRLPARGDQGRGGHCERVQAAPVAGGRVGVLLVRALDATAEARVHARGYSCVHPYGCSLWRIPCMIHGQQSLRRTSSQPHTPTRNRIHLHTATRMNASARAHAPYVRPRMHAHAFRRLFARRPASSRLAHTRATERTRTHLAFSRSLPSRGHASPVRACVAATRSFVRSGA